MEICGLNVFMFINWNEDSFIEMYWLLVVFFVIVDVGKLMFFVSKELFFLCVFNIWWMIVVVVVLLFVFVILIIGVLDIW